MVGLGGSACADGGRGPVDEFAGLDAGRRRLTQVELIAVSDVEYPLPGPWGAARVDSALRSAGVLAADAIAD